MQDRENLVSKPVALAARLAALVGPVEVAGKIIKIFAVFTLL